VLEPLADIPRDERSGIRVLDLPAGGGCVAWTLQSAGFDATPCDILPERYDESVERLGGLSARVAFEKFSGNPAPPRFRRNLWGDDDPPFPRDLACTLGDMEQRLPFDDESFDYVVSVEGIEHVSDRQGLLREFRRVTRKGGRLIITTPNMLNLRARVSMALSGFRSTSSWLDEYSGVQGRSKDGSRVYHGHAFLLDYNEMRYSLHQAGFKLKRLLPMPESSSSRWLWPLLFPLVWASTRRTCFLGKRKFEKLRKRGRVPPDAPNPADEIFRHLMSREMLCGAILGVEAMAD
jgi:SAM-dependent methyltransferase